MDRIDPKELAELIRDLERGLRESCVPEDRRLATDCIAALAPCLASAVLGEDILRRLPTVEALLGKTKFVDATPFGRPLSTWSSFREKYRRSILSGMTVNERLSALGTLQVFERAREAGDSQETRRLLADALVDEASIDKIVGAQTKG